MHMQSRAVCEPVTCTPEGDQHTYRSLSGLCTAHSVAYLTLLTMSRRPLGSTFEVAQEREQEQSLCSHFSDEYLWKEGRKGGGEEVNKPVPSCRKIRKLQIDISISLRNIDFSVIYDKEKQNIY